MEIETKAYSQVSYIISSMSPALKSKIPSIVIEAIENKKDKSYKMSGKVSELHLLSDTKKILSYLYTDYIANNEEKEVIKNKERIISRNNEQEKGLYKDIFNHQVLKNQTVQKEEENRMILKEKKWYIQIFNKIKKLFVKRNK